MKRRLSLLQRYVDDVPMMVLGGTLGFACVSILLGGQGCSSYKPCQNTLASLYDWKDGAPDDSFSYPRDGTVRVENGKVILESSDASLEVVWTIEHSGWSHTLW